MSTKLYEKMFFYFTLISMIAVFALFNLSVNRIKHTDSDDGVIEWMHINVPEKIRTKSMVETKNSDVELNKVTGFLHTREGNMKYILLWTLPNMKPFNYLAQGQKTFIERKCPYTNCFVTDNRMFFKDYTTFDVIAFNGPQVIGMTAEKLPARRSPHQKFVFASKESSDVYPVCSKNLDGFFNWTWTYRLDSEVIRGYVVVKDSINKVIGPNIEMHWIKLEDMDPISDNLKNLLKSKTKAVAWFASNCKTKSSREVKAVYLGKQLEKHNLTLDIFGKCGIFNCPRGKNEHLCNERLERDYYFYLSFENALSEDYVTEKLLLPLQYNTVPIVYGGANYTRFMPDGMYINARELDVEKLAIKIDKLIKNPEKYYEYFRWKNHYSYHKRGQNVETDDFCHFCAMLNNETLMKTKSNYQKFKKWWNPPRKC